MGPWRIYSLQFYSIQFQFRDHHNKVQISPRLVSSSLGNYQAEMVIISFRLLNETKFAHGRLYQSFFTMESGEVWKMWGKIVSSKMILTVGTCPQKLSLSHGTLASGKGSKQRCTGGQCLQLRSGRAPVMSTVNTHASRSNLMRAWRKRL